jgi:hypothetical protein
LGRCTDQIIGTSELSLGLISCALAMPAKNTILRLAGTSLINWGLAGLDHGNRWNTRRKKDERVTLGFLRPAEVFAW